MITHMPAKNSELRMNKFFKKLCEIKCNSFKSTVPWGFVITATAETEQFIHPNGPLLPPPTGPAFRPTDSFSVSKFSRNEITE